MKIYTYNTIVVGTGAAGYNAALRLKQFGVNVAIVTEDINFGTSRNTGSDKQTYYKLGLGGDSPDSVVSMANDLFAGGSVDGDNAMCEAALSVRSFMNLCELGVEFPVNRYGEYIGYKTDHDPYARATSAGPLTSKFMTEVLEKRVSELNVEVFSGYLAIEILKADNRVCGFLCIEKDSGEMVAFNCPNVVWATGGPAGIYADSVYPICHTGTTSVPLLAGAKCQNLTEWQYGLASINPRWNVSGTYMQVLPRFVSVDENGEEYEFLADYFEDLYEGLSAVFLKGYQWPFDSAKVLEGSSVIDILVYRECVLKGRRVFLDYTKNSFGIEEINYEKLSSEAYEYLEKSGACFGKPIDRLFKMNKPAVELYAGKGVDITKEYLEIALCAQHNNGGISVDMWWQTSIRGLFAVGECAGTHGVARPGGSALNAGQVGSLRAAQFISMYSNESVTKEHFETVLDNSLLKHNVEKLLKEQNTINHHIKKAKRRMSDIAGAIRNRESMTELLETIKKELSEIENTSSVKEKADVYMFYKLKDVLVVQTAVLTAFIDYAKTAKDTRGSALYTDDNGKQRCGLEDVFRFCPENRENRSKIQEVYLEDDDFKTNWRMRRPIPEKGDFFENIWRTYRENKNIF